MSESDLAFIQRCVREGRLLWTYHVNMRLRQRRVARPMVTESMDSYQIIEQYPQSQASRYLPSCLVYAEHHGESIHILFALDREGDNARVITVYRPDPAQWEADFLRRKKP
ncbi:MAG: DUF4258 domain-containing protein [Gammaproteobacteria bacterium]|nr:DUF4258 domain-containing protein [Gammaproteobacteria bacterium]